MVECKADVGFTHRAVLALSVAYEADRADHVVVQLIETFTCKLRKDGLAVLEVMVRCLVAHARATRDFAHRQGAEPAFVHQLKAGIEDSGANVVLAGSPGNCCHVSPIYYLTLSRRSSPSVKRRIQFRDISRSVCQPRLHRQKSPFL